MSIKSKTKHNAFDLSKLNKDNDEFNLKAGTYYIDPWFNDMFAWALSYAMTFAVNKGKKETVKEFHRWLDEGGLEFFRKFDQVKYPEKNLLGQYKKGELDRYFSENSKIGEQLAKSLNQFCGRNLNDEEI